MININKIFFIVILLGILFISGCNNQEPNYKEQSIYDLANLKFDKYEQFEMNVPYDNSAYWGHCYQELYRKYPKMIQDNVNGINSWCEIKSVYIRGSITQYTDAETNKTTIYVGDDQTMEEGLSYLVSCSCFFKI